MELYGTPIQEGKIDTFYVAISNPIIFTKFEARFCMPTSTTSNLQIVSMCTNNGLILELKATSETASFYQGLLKSFNCSLLSAFGQENERLFIGGWAPLEFANIRKMVCTAHNYKIFVKAIKQFESALSGEEDDDLDLDASYSLDRTNTSYSSIYSEYSHLSGVDTDGVDVKSQLEDFEQYEKKKIDAMVDEKKCSNTEFIIIRSLAKQMMDFQYENGFPSYVNAMFRSIVQQRGEIFMNLSQLKGHYSCFERVLISDECATLPRFDFLCRLFENCKVITVDLHGHRKLTAKFLMALCDQMMKIERYAEDLRLDIGAIVLLKIEKKYITLDIWDKIRRKYDEFEDRLWYKCLSMFRYNSDGSLKIFFSDEAHDAYERSQRELDGDFEIETSQSGRQQTDEVDEEEEEEKEQRQRRVKTIKTTQSYAL